jgi:branched-chain amino acid transport system substrate-binding protein
MGRSFPRHRWCAGALVLAAIGGPACGGRMTRQDIQQALQVTGGESAASPAPRTPSGQTGHDVAPAQGGADTGTASSAGSTAAVRGAPAGQPGASEAPTAKPITAGDHAGPSGATSNRLAEAPRPGTADPTAADRSTPPATGPATDQGGSSVTTRSTILLAQIGTWSGPIGAAFKEMITGLRIWVQDANARGGVAGHPMQLLVADDGGDPARYQALLKEMVETRGAFAFVGNNGVFTGPAGQAYLESKRVPVVGGDVANSVWTQSPMYFPQATTLDGMINSVPVSTARFNDKKKVGILTCLEVEACRIGNRVWPEYSKKLGLEVVYNGQASVTQPEFTAECINARNAGAEVMEIALDASTLIRWGKACSQLGYRPRIFVPAEVLEAKLEGDVAGGIFEGLVGSIPNAPFMLSDTPGLAAFQSAKAKYASNASVSLSTILGWTAGRLFERVAKDLGAEPTREALLVGLWSVANDTLEGLSPPLTFIQNKPAPSVACFFVVKIVDHKLTAPSGSKQVCP